MTTIASTSIPSEINFAIDAPPIVLEAGSGASPSAGAASLAGALVTGAVLADAPPVAAPLTDAALLCDFCAGSLGAAVLRVDLDEFDFLAKD
jgi:hypothetical protein